MRDESPKGPSVPGDLAIGCVIHIVAIAALVVSAGLAEHAGLRSLTPIGLWFYAISMVVLFGLQFYRRRPFVAAGIILLPVLAALVAGACYVVNGPPRF